MKVLSHKFFTKTFTLLFFTSVSLFCFSACNTKAEQKSLYSHFEMIDALILQNQNKDALKELKKLEKIAYDPWSYIGIYKRYSNLGQTELSEKLLKKALKNNSDNKELIAVYSKFLLKNQKLDDAVEISKKLKGSKYGSIYSEAILSQTAKAVKDSQDNLLKFYTNPQFYQIYYDAYTGSQNPVWLKNCAIYNLTKGEYSKAALLNPAVFKNAEDAYFWALVLYDAGKYTDSIKTCEISKKYLNDFYGNTDSAKVSYTKQIALQSDSYMAVSEIEKSQKIAADLISNIDNISRYDSDNEILPVIFANNAIWLKNQNKTDEYVDLLFYTVNNWPTFTPALLMYSDFAYESNLERNETSQQKALRDAGLRSNEMALYDARRKIPLSDALYRLDSAIKTNPDPYLNIKRLDLRYKTDSSTTQKDKNRDLWHLLEDNNKIDSKYKTLLLQYALNYLLNTKQFNEAWQLYSNYLNEKIVFDEKKDFWQQFEQAMPSLDSELIEFGGWFAADSKIKDPALHIYEYCVFSANPENKNQISPEAATSACLNLADIYYSCGNYKEALDIYGKVAGRESNNKTRSEIFYRIAGIYKSTGDKKNALRAAEYAKELYPENVRASLLKESLSIQ